MRQVISNILSFMFIISAGLLFLAYMLNRRLFPLALQTVAVSQTGEINRAFYAALHAFAAAPSGYIPTDFYTADFDDTGKLAAIFINTINANKVCDEIARSITNDMEGLGDVTVEIPLGAAIGGGLFNAITPNIPITVTPIGAAEADYIGELTSAGINQVNYKIWLNVKVRVKVVNAMLESETVVTRRAALVDAVFPGETPKLYLENGK